MFMSLTLPTNRTTGMGPGDPRLNLEDGKRFLSASEISAFLRRHAYVILIPMAAALVLAVVYVEFATPIYTARAQLIIDPRIPEQLRLQTGDQVASLDTAQVESQIAVLRSERIATMVIGKLDLMNAPDFQPRSSVLGQIMGLFRSEKAPGPLSKLEAERRTIETFAEGLDVRRAGLSYAMDVSFSSPNPARAAEIANATAEAYIEDQLAARSQAARVGGDWLEQRTLELRTQMNAAARAVQEFKAGHDYRIIKRPTGDAQTGAGLPPPPPRNTLEELETTAYIYRRVYESFLQGFTEAVQRQSFPVSDARILTPATAPLAPSEPRSKLVLALGALLGTMVGFSLALTRHHLDRTVRGSHQLRNELGIECLGQLPVLPGMPGLDPPRRALSAPSREPTSTAPAAMVTAQQPPPEGHHYFDEVLKPVTSRFRDELLGVKTLIDIYGRSSPLHCFGVTSVNAGEGKSTIASNLATLFAASGQRVLIVDANLRSRSLTKKVAPHAPLGLTEVLRGIAPLGQAVVPVARGRVDLLPVAGAESGISGNEVVSSDAVHLLLLEAVQAYDIVIVDLPPLMPVDAALTLSAILDGVVIAVQWGATSIDALGEAVHWLGAARAKILGAVITKAEA